MLLPPDEDFMPAEGAPVMPRGCHVPGVAGNVTWNSPMLCAGSAGLGLGVRLSRLPGAGVYGISAQSGLACGGEMR
jgi:hypothetical protein